MMLWLNKLKNTKTAPWLLALICCALALLLLPAGNAKPAGMTEEEQRVSATLSQIAGAGEVRVSIYYAQEVSAFGSGNRTPVGAVIVAQGAGDLSVRLNLLRAAETLLGLDANRVDVFLMEEKP
ncbi:MAG: hypothetical protein IJS41_10355 [Clostridia bacterium]|nr:hypothetical protein [Clostridia bacterium]